MARKKVKPIIADRISIVTPPPYVPDQSIRIHVHRGPPTAVPMRAIVQSLDEASITISFGGGKEETLQLRSNGVALDSTLTKPKKSSSKRP